MILLLLVLARFPALPLILLLVLLVLLILRLALAAPLVQAAPVNAPAPDAVVGDALMSHDDMVVVALSLIGTPYKFGGASPEAGFDCSGLVKYILGLSSPITLPRNKTLVLYCPCTGDDADAIDMAKKLRMFGYFNTKILRGGWFQWEELGYPIESTDSEEDA